MSTPWAPAVIIWAFSALALAESLPDPTRPSGKAAVARGPAPQSLTLSAIVGERAVINGQALKEGDRLGATRVLKVGSNSVTLARGNQRWQVQLFDTHNKKTTACEGNHCG